MDTVESDLKLNFSEIYIQNLLCYWARVSDYNPVRSYQLFASCSFNHLRWLRATSCCFFSLFLSLLLGRKFSLDENRQFEISWRKYGSSILAMNHKIVNNATWFGKPLVYEKLSYGTYLVKWNMRDFSCCCWYGIPMEKLRGIQTVEILMKLDFHKFVVRNFYFVTKKFVLSSEKISFNIFTWPAMLFKIYRKQGQDCCLKTFKLFKLKSKMFWQNWTKESGKNYRYYFRQKIFLSLAPSWRTKSSTWQAENKISTNILMPETI